MFSPLIRLAHAEILHDRYSYADDAVCVADEEKKLQRNNCANHKTRLRGIEDGDKCEGNEGRCYW